MDGNGTSEALLLLTFAFALTFGGLMQMFLRSSGASVSRLFSLRRAFNYDYAIAMVLSAVWDFRGLLLTGFHERFVDLEFVSQYSAADTYDNSLRYVIMMAAFGTCVFLTRTTLSLLVSLTILSLGLNLAHDIFTAKMYQFLPEALTKGISLSNMDLWYAYSLSCQFLLNFLLFAVIVVARQIMFATKGAVMVMQRSSRLSRTIPLVLIVFTAFGGFYILAATKAVLWLLFLSVCYPVMAAFSSSLIDGTKYSSKGLTDLYVQSLKSLPLFQTLLGARTAALRTAASAVPSNASPDNAANIEQPVPVAPNSPLE